MYLNSGEIFEGMSLPEVHRKVLQENVIRYAETSGDHNPIHLDPAFAVKMGLKGTVAHGMLILAYLSSYLTANFGAEWLNTGALNVKFKEPGRPGDVLTITGKIIKIVKQENFISVSCDILCRNERNEIVITGEATVKLKESYVI